MTDPVTAERQVLAATTLVTGERVLRPGWLEIHGDRVAVVGEGQPPRPAEHRYDATVLPGVVDVHVHGGGGASFTSGDQEEAARVADLHRRHGTTTMLASLVSAPPRQLLDAVARLADLVEDGMLAGIHLEGPWLNPDRRGAHDAHALRDPDPDEVEALLRAARGTIRMVTLAPERSGGLGTVRRLAEAGVTVAVGHTDADYATTREAIDAGARVATHLFNAMPPLHHREPGPALALLEDPRVVVELVPDGVHLHPAVVRHVLASAGPRRTALVTDAMGAAGMPDGEYQLGSLPVSVAGGRARLRDGTLAGSTATAATLLDAARTALADSADRLSSVAAVTAGTPAGAIGLDRAGGLEPGQLADLVVVDETAGLTRVMSRGRWVS